MQYFPNGIQFAISNPLKDLRDITSITNASPAVVTTSAPLADGSIILVQSGWGGLNNRVVEVISSASTTFNLEGIDTTNKNIFPEGAGTGSFLVASGWTGTPQVTDISTSGGEQQYYTWQYAEDLSGRQQQRPTYKNSRSIVLKLDYDPNTAWHEALLAADQSKEITILRASLPSGDTLYWPVYVSFEQEPSMEVNKNMQVNAVFSTQAVVTRTIARI